MRKPPIIASQAKLQRELLDGQVRLLRAMVQIAEMEPSNLARAANLAPSTVNRVLSGEQHTVISTLTIAALTRAVERRLAEFGDPARRQQWESAIKEWNALATLNPELRGIEVVGHVLAGEWQTALKWPRNARYRVDLPMRAELAGKAFALEIRGHGMDREYPAGTVAVCVRYSDLGREPRPKENVVCYHHDRDGRVEATIKKLEVDAQGRRWLVPQSTDPGLQKPIPLDERKDGVKSLELFAVVIGSYRPEPIEI
jgi:SOS-response transcriptional repressor LexA